MCEENGQESAEVLASEEVLGEIEERVLKEVQKRVERKIRNLGIIISTLVAIIGTIATIFGIATISDYFEYQTGKTVIPRVQAAFEIDDLEESKKTINVIRDQVVSSNNRISALLESSEVDAARVAQVVSDVDSDLDAFSERLIANQLFVETFSNQLAQSVTDLPIGTILPWYVPDEQLHLTLDKLNKTLPPGWFACDGDNGTPDLQDRFLMGTIEPTRLRERNGSNSIPIDGSHRHSTDGSGFAGFDRLLGGEGGVAVPTDHSHGVSDEGAHEHGGDNRPAYQAVIFIMRVKRFDG